MFTMFKKAVASLKTKTFQLAAKVTSLLPGPYRADDARPNLSPLTLDKPNTEAADKLEAARRAIGFIPLKQVSLL
jgi:hypothetical protein